MEISQERQELLDAIAAEYAPTRQRVVIISDTNHYRGLELLRFTLQTAAALRPQGVTAVGLEIVGAYEQNLYDALYEKRLSKDNFLRVINPSAETSSGQNSTNDLRQMYLEIADAIEGGLRVYGLNTRAYAPENPEIDALAEKKLSLEYQIAIDNIAFFNEHAAEITQDPKAFYNKMQALAELPADVSMQIQETLNTALAKNADTQNSSNIPYSLAIGHILTHQHPATAQIQEISDQLDARGGERDTDPEVYARKRYSADEIVAQNIIRHLETHQGIVVQYGALHTVYGRNGTRDVGKEDLDGALRERGVSPMIVSPYFGAGTVECRPLMPKFVCDVWPDIAGYLQEHEKNSGDSDRYTIPDIQVPTLLKQETFPSPQDPKLKKWSLPPSY